MTPTSTHHPSWRDGYVIDFSALPTRELRETAAEGAWKQTHPWMRNAPDFDGSSIEWMALSEPAYVELVCYLSN